MIKLLILLGCLIYESQSQQSSCKQCCPNEEAPESTLAAVIWGPILLLTFIIMIIYAFGFQYKYVQGVTLHPSNNNYSGLYELNNQKVQFRLVKINQQDVILDFVLKIEGNQVSFKQEGHSYIGNIEENKILKLENNLNMLGVISIQVMPIYDPHTSKFRLIGNFIYNHMNKYEGIIVISSPGLGVIKDSDTQISLTKQYQALLLLTTFVSVLSLIIYGIWDKEIQNLEINFYDPAVCSFPFGAILSLVLLAIYYSHFSITQKEPTINKISYAYRDCQSFRVFFLLFAFFLMGMLMGFGTIKGIVADFIYNLSSVIGNPCRAIMEQELQDMDNTCRDKKSTIFIKISHQSGDCQSVIYSIGNYFMIQGLIELALTLCYMFSYLVTQYTIQIQEEIQKPVKQGDQNNEQALQMI